MRGLLLALVMAGSIAAPQSPVLACLWDYDTLAMERERFPEVIELITGKFLRHSPGFYKWRIQDRKTRLEEGEGTPNLYDDLAVAYEKIGNHQKAIETILQKAELFPGLYETHANLGTFYIHAGELERGIEEIERAVAINPDAHFGREIYQKLLVEYVLSKQVEGKTQLPLDDNPRGGFAEYVLEQKGLIDDYDKHEEELKKALQGVLGMMRFGNHDSPVLLEALANVLLMPANKDAKRLAACAYLKASYETRDEETREAYRDLATQALSMQTKGKVSSEELTLEELEEVFSKQLAEAEQWYEELEADEKSWIEAGVNPEEEFLRKYDEEPRLSTAFEGDKLTRFQEVVRKSHLSLTIAVLAASMLVVVLSVLGFRILRGFKARSLKENV